MTESRISAMTVDARLLSALPAELYQVLYLRVVRRLTIEETSRQLRVPPNAVRVRQHRAMEALRRHIAA